MKIVSARILAAGNAFSRFPVVRLLFSGDGTPEADLPSSIGRAIAHAIPPIGDRRAEILDYPAWRYLQSAQAPVSATLVVETLALLIQRWVNWPVDFSGFELDAAARDAAAIFETRHAEAGLRAGEISVLLLDSLRSDGPDRLQADFRAGFEAYRKETAGITPTIDTLAIARRAQRRGIPWSSTPGINYLRLGHGRYANILFGSESTKTSSMGRMLAKRKPTTNAILAAAGLPVAAQRTARSAEEALDAARWIGFPVVVKPATGNLGRSVTVGVADENQLGKAFEDARAVSREVVIEAFIKGDDYRLLVVGGKFFAASCRRPAQVMGDGVSTVRQLVDRENLNPERHSDMHSHLKPIAIDDTARSCLAEQGLSPDAVPRSGQVVLLRRIPNVSQGGTAVDMTDAVHPSIRDVAERAAAVLGIDVCGVDFITDDIGRPFRETGGAICEVNTRAGLGLHLAVVEGTPRDAADAIVGMLYPEGSPSRIPLVAILKDSGTDDLQNAIEAAAAGAGRRIGLVSSGRSVIGTQVSPVRSLSHLDGVEAITLDGTIDAGVVVVTPREVVRSGVGLDRIDLAILPPGDRPALARQACEILSHIADGRVIDRDDPAVLGRALEILGAPGGAATASVSPGERKERGDGSDFTMLLLGDIGFGESYVKSPRMAALRRTLAIKGHRYSLARLTDLLDHADLTIGNLEVPLAARSNPALHGRKNYLGWSDADETVSALVEAGFDAVSLANNHSLDCGEAGLRDTVRLVQEFGMTAFGAGADLAAASRPFVRTVRVGPVERTIVVFACFEFREKYDREFSWYAGAGRPGINPIEPEAIAGRIADLRKTVPAPLFIAYPHWGIDYEDTADYQRELAERLIAAGVDVIIGHGAHCLQGIERISGRPVVFGIGNCAWNAPGRFSRRAAPPYGLAAVLRLRHAGDGVSALLRLYPLLIDNNITNFQNRPVSAVEFPEALAVLTKNYDGPPEQLVSGIDRLGHYVEIPTGTQAASV